MKVSLPYQGFDLGFSTLAKAIWSNDGRSGFELVALTPRQRSLMENFRDRLTGKQSKERTSNTQRPHTHQHTEPDVKASHTSPSVSVPKVTSAVPAESHPNKLPAKKPDETLPRHTLLRSAIYLGLGLFLTYFMLTSLYALIFRLNIDSAVVSRPVEKMTAAIDGIIQRIDAQPGQFLAVNQPLMAIAGINEKASLLEAETALAEARLNEKKKESEYDSALRAIKVYSTINADKEEAARARLNAARQNLQALRRDKERREQLADSGLVTLSEADRARIRYQNGLKEVQQAQSELKSLQAVSQSIKDGSYYSNLRKEIDLSELRSELESARAQVALARHQLASINEVNGFTLKTPYPARVINITKSPGNTVSRSEVVAVLEKVEKPVIDAFLTQDQLPQIQLGKIANIYIPALDRKLQGRVVSIDRTAAFTQDDAIRFAWQESDSKSGRVTLEILQADDLQSSWDALAGLPAEVSFRRNLWGGHQSDPSRLAQND